MAKTKTDIAAQCKAIMADAEAGKFSPVYLLMGDEPFYPELVCKSIIDNCLQESEKDFNETICYGNDVNADQIITTAMRFPMMAERQLVVVKEAQLMKDIEDLAAYCARPLGSTVLVILLHKAAVNRAKQLYKSVKATGTVVDSPQVRDYEIANWIISYYSSLELKISPEAAGLLGESAGTELSVIAVETDKLLKNLPEGTKEIGITDIENNVGISRQYSIFELTRELSGHNGPKALKIAFHLSNSAKFSMPMAVSAIYNHFHRILLYGSLLQKGRYPSDDDKRKALGDVNPYFYREYDTAVRNYPVAKSTAIISMLTDYDYLGKGGDGGGTTDEGLLMELVAKILSI